VLLHGAISQNRGNRVSQASNVAFRNKQAGGAVLHDFRDAADAISDDRHAHRLCFTKD